MGIEEKTCDCGVRVYHVLFEGYKLYCHVKHDYGKDKYFPHTCQVKQYERISIIGKPIAK